MLGDSGACTTVVKNQPSGLRFSNKVVLVRSATGHVVACKKSHPIIIVDETTGRSCSISILVDPACPVNLLGRDALNAMRIAIVPTKTGMALEAMLMDEVQAVVQGEGQPHYYYTLDLTPTGGPLTELNKRANEQTAGHETDDMNPSDLHVTMYYCNHKGPDVKYSKAFLKEPLGPITLQHLYVTPTGNAVASVMLNPQQQPFFRMYSLPHVSVSRDQHTRWRDLGRVCESAARHRYVPDPQDPDSDWKICPENGIKRLNLGWKVRTTPTAHLEE